MKYVFFIFVYNKIQKVPVFTRYLCLYLSLPLFWLVQWKPLIVITLVRHQTDNINRMITITDCAIYWEKVKIYETYLLNCDNQIN